MTTRKLSTFSYCYECEQPVPAFYERRGDAVYLIKTCPEHGESRALASENAEEFFKWIDFPSVTVPPRVFVTKGTPKKSSIDDESCNKELQNTECPHHCGPCENHLMTACCVLLNVTARCNQHCPYCFAEAERHGDGVFPQDPSLEEIRKRLDCLTELGEERKFNIQLSGGEPTVRDDLPEIISMCKAKGFEYIQLNTNGKRLSEDPGYAKELKAAGLSVVFLQFDGVSDDVYERLRGEPLLEGKKTAIQNCKDAALPVTLVPTVLKTVNLSQTGAIICFMLENLSVVKGVHFQPASFFGRKPDEQNEEGDFDERVTMFAVMDEIEKQTKGRIKKADLAPISTGHPLCCFCAAYTKEPSGELRPFSSGGACCGESGDPGEIVRRDRDFVMNKWDIQAPEEVPEEAGRGEACCAGAPLSFDDALAMFKNNTFTISGMAFMDETNLDAERLRRCRVQVFSPDERLIPFCAYYTYHSAKEK